MKEFVLLFAGIGIGAYVAKKISDNNKLKEENARLKAKLAGEDK